MSDPSPETLKPCPFCGNDRVDSFEDSDRQVGPLGFRVSCWGEDGGCSTNGPWAKLEQDARRLWNERI